MLNQLLSLRPPLQLRWRCIMLLFLLTFNFLGLMPSVKAQEAASSPGSVTPTSATTDKNGNVTVTVKSTDLSPDNASATVTATSQGVSGTGTVTFNGALEIKKGNMDVTKGSTQSYVGEQQGLSVTTRSGTAITSATWTVNGATPIKNWVQSNPSNPSASLTTYLAASDLNQTSLSFYVTTAGTASVNVSASDSGGSGTANTSFNVSVPSFTFSASQAGVYSGKDLLSLGSYFTGGSSPGITFTGSGGTNSGSLSFAQFLTAQDATVTFSDSSSGPILPQPNMSGLDGRFPYGNTTGAPPGNTSDTPNSNQQDISTTDIRYKNFAATMYLMWTSSKANALPIPVMSISWSWQGEATFNTSTGTGTVVAANSSKPTSRTGTAVSIGVLNWGTTWNPIK